MKRYAKPNTDVSTWQQKAESSSDESAQLPPSAIGDISIDRLIDDGLIALYREVKNIVALSAKGKLDAPTARDLRDHLKLLFELKEIENAALRSLSDEQLKERAKQALND